MKDLLTRNETAEILNVTLVTLHYWRHKGKLRGIKKGYRRFYFKEDVERLQKEQLQLELEDQRPKRSVDQLKFFEGLNEKLTEQEKVNLMSSHVPEQEYRKLILTLAKKYDVSVPLWFRKECKQWNVTV